MKKNSLNNLSFSTNESEPTIEVVEKKGIGHPDSMADSIAEELSCVINDYFINKYGEVPRYNTDQVSIIGGDVDFNFGSGEIKKKSVIDLAGNIPYLNEDDISEIQEISEKQIYSYLTNILSFDARELFQIEWRINHYSEKNSSFFQDAETALAEDTVVACGFYPYSDLEKLTLDTNEYIETHLSKEYPIGCDTKILAIKSSIQNKVELIISMGFKALEIQDSYKYFVIKQKVKEKIDNFVTKKIPSDSEISVKINAADDEKQGKGYVLLSGSASEHDKGISSKGNRLSGLITPFRHNSFETVFGKNPIYHTGKIYNVLSFLLAKEISTFIDDKVEIFIVSELGMPMANPKAINIVTGKPLSKEREDQVSLLITQEMKKYFTKRKLPPNLMVLSEEIIKNGNLTQFKI